MGKKADLLQKLSPKQKRCLDYLVKNGSITQDEARAKLGDGRLSETIRELRLKGYEIDTYRIDIENRYGEPTWYGKYVLRE